MSKATLLYLKERPVNSESQGSQSNPNSARAIVKEQKLLDTTARYRSSPDMSIPPSRDSAKPNVNSSSRGQLLGGSAETHGLGIHGIHTPSHSPPPEHPVHDEGGMALVSSSEEHNSGISGNKVIALRPLQRVLRQKELITGSNSREIMGIFEAGFTHIYYTIRISPSRSRSSIDALREVCLFHLYLYAKPIVVSGCSAWTLRRRPIPTRRCLA